jgi:hypothetical protein
MYHQLKILVRFVLILKLVLQIPNHGNNNNRDEKNIFLYALADEEANGLVKMCLFYPNESGHARTDPILNPSGPSDHVHTVSCCMLVLFSVVVLP